MDDDEQRSQRSVEPAQHKLQPAARDIAGFHYRVGDPPVVTAEPEDRAARVRRVLAESRALFAGMPVCASAEIVAAKPQAAEIVAAEPVTLPEPKPLQPPADADQTWRDWLASEFAKERALLRSSVVNFWTCLPTSASQSKRSARPD